MKKLVALLLALFMLGSVAFAEENAEEPATTLEAKDIMNFDIAMDAIPEGYTMEKKEIEGDLLAIFTPEDETKVSVYISIAYSEIYDGYTLNAADMDEEAMANLEDVMGEDYNMPSFTLAQTEHGTELIVIDETEADSDYGEILTVYQGYIISASLLKQDSLTREDYELAVKILSDLWIVDK